MFEAYAFVFDNNTSSPNCICHSRHTYVAYEVDDFSPDREHVDRKKEAYNVHEITKHCVVIYQE